MKNAGFTLIEIIVVLGVFAILLGISFAAIGNFRDDSDLEHDTKNIQAVFRLAQSRTVSSNGDTRYGVYFNTASTPHEYILFQTETDYASRVILEDVVYKVSDLVQFSLIDFNPLSGQEVVFDRIQGTTSNDGNVVLQSTKDTGKTRAIWVSNGGSIEIGGTSLGDEGNCTDDSFPGDRMCDSRHMHVTYEDREIETATEVITLDFLTETFDIILADNLSGEQIYWEGTVKVDGDDQVLKIQTHTINESGWVTVFSIHRDRRFNNKPLKITISGDGSGKLIEYDAIGMIITGGESSKVTNTQEQ